MMISVMQIVIILIIMVIMVIIEHLGHKSLPLPSLLLLQQLCLLLTLPLLLLAVTWYVPHEVVHVGVHVEELEELILKSVWEETCPFKLSCIEQSFPFCWNMNYPLEGFEGGVDRARINLLLSHHLLHNRQTFLHIAPVHHDFIADLKKFWYLQHLSSFSIAPGSTIHQHLARHPRYSQGPPILLHHKGPVIHVTHLQR